MEVNVDDLCHACDEAWSALQEVKDDVETHGIPSTNPPQRTALEATFFDARARLAKEYYSIVRQIVEARDQSIQLLFRHDDTRLAWAMDLLNQSYENAHRRVPGGLQAHPREGLVSPLLCLISRIEDTVINVSIIHMAEEVLYGDCAVEQRSPFFRQLREQDSANPISATIKSTFGDKIKRFYSSVIGEGAPNNDRIPGTEFFRNTPAARKMLVAAASEVEGHLYEALVRPCPVLSHAAIAARRERSIHYGKLLLESAVGAAFPEELEYNMAWIKLIRDSEWGR
ncbi:hypothetical protein B0T16DRAFT_407817 [Cercophora newfieldiana]|uniref:Uncharacterized protein n=1 Tax=Cercophora newfieldiana TaxID=92897 RepID=A0AA39Y908_9PEZI|nr:hypothetical protein B0T16DRAFT_407817 [Cercophora newfieldiana]